MLVLAANQQTAEGCSKRKTNYSMYCLLALALEIGHAAASANCPSTPLAATCLSRLPCRNATLTQCTVGCYAQSLQCYISVNCRGDAEGCTTTLASDQVACSSSELPCSADGSCVSQHTFRCGQALLLVAPSGPSPVNAPQSDWAIGLAVSTVLLALVVVVCVAVIARLKKQLDVLRASASRYIGIEVKPMRQVSTGTPSSLSSSLHQTAGRSPNGHLASSALSDEKRLSGVSLELGSSTRERQASDSLSQAHVQICPEPEADSYAM